jgi:putative ATP-binding cassette transporter
VKKKLTLSLSSFKSLSKVIVPFFKGERKRQAWLYLFLLLSMLILVSVIGVKQSYFARDFINSLARRDVKGFYASSIWYALALACATVVAVLYRYTEERLALVWREWMTSRLVHRYLTTRNYYRLRWNEEIDNPDQRIAEDVRNFTATSLSLFLILLNSIITLCAFIGVLAFISWDLVWTLLVYTIVGTFLTTRVGRKLVRIHNRQYAREANFRYGLVRIRDNAESVAFFRGERREKIDLAHRFRDLVRNTKSLISWNRNLNFFTTGYNNLSLILPVIVIAPHYFKGNMEIGDVTQAAGAFAQVLAASSVIISQFERISAYVAGVTRLDTLWDEVNRHPDDEDEPPIEVEEGAKLILTDLTIRPPNSARELVKDLSLKLKPGSGILIMGPSGSGKSSILRTIAGLWDSGEGSIERPSYRDMMFLPQKPYMPPGSLRNQLLYPNRERTDYDKQLSKVLNLVNLENILKRVEGRLDVVMDWGNVLSLGEQQRISFARLFLWEPKISFLDEATSALDESNEEDLYKIMRKMKLTFISVGHRSTLIQYHDQVLNLKDDGSWELEKAKDVA